VVLVSTQAMPEVRPNPSLKLTRYVRHCKPGLRCFPYIVSVPAYSTCLQGQLISNVGRRNQHLSMRRVTLSGGPGAGKTSLLAELSRRGYSTVSDSARELIAERMARGWRSPRHPAMAQ